MSKKTSCEKTSMIAYVIDAKVEEKVNAAVRAAMPKAEITKETLPAFFEDLHNLLWNKAGLSPERALEHMTFFFAYRLIEPQADALQLPQECRWSYLASHKNENDTYETMKKGCVAFQKNKVTKPFFKKPEIDKAMIIYEIVEQISRISLTILQETDTLGDIFEYMLGRGMSTMSDEGQYFTNRAICKLAFKLAYDIKKTLRRADGSLCTFADWFCGTGGFPAEFVKGVNANDPLVNWKKDAGSLFCQDMNLSSVTTTLLNMLILTGIPFSGDTIRGSNSFTDAITMGAGAPFPGLTVDYCFMNPPYGGDKSKGREYKFAYSKTVKGDDGTSKKFFVNQEIQSIGVEDDDKVSAGVQLAMATLSEGGVCCIVLPQGFFFGTSKKCVELRKKIAEDYKIWSIVDIASGSFLNTGTKTSMMVFQKGVGATETMSFIGLDERMLVEATLEDLRSKNYSLNYKQYLPQSAVEVDGFEMVKLGDLVNFSGGKFTTGYSKEHPGEYPFFSGKTHQPDGTCKDFCFDGDEYLVLIKDGGSGVGIYGDKIGMGKIFYVKGRSAGTSHNAALHKKSERVLLMYLYYYLKSIKSAIMDLAKYTTGLGVISQGDLRELQIPLPSLSKQQEIVEQIDFYTQMAHTEEQSLNILEKIVMGWVKEMGRGKERVKLGEVCEIRYGDKNTTYDTTELYPGIGGGIAPSSYVPHWNIDAYTLIVSRSGSAGHVSRYPTKASAGSFAFVCLTKKDKVLDDYLYFVVKHTEEYIKTLPEGTVQQNLNRDVLRSVEIPLPSLAEQQMLQSDFDEIRHKHAKIAEYKAKAQEAIQRLIPGAKKETEKVEVNQIIVPITMSHTSTCLVEQDGSGCTCRLPLPIEKDEEHTIASTVSTSVTPATAAVKRRKPKIAPKISVE
jgi:restriction endonuclease S subunit/type I restriction-modification system DNA methylase subunit